MKKSTVRRIDALKITRRGNELQITVTGDGFLYNMVRIMVGTLLRIQQGKIPVDGIAGIIEKKDRKLLLHSKQIAKLYSKVTKDGITLVATKLYFNDKNMIKVEVATAQGKKLHDKREDLKIKTMQRETQQILKGIK